MVRGVLAQWLPVVVACLLRARAGQPCLLHGRPSRRPKWLTLPDGNTSGVEVRFFDADGRQLGQQHRHAASLFWWEPIEDDLDVAKVDHLEVRTCLRVSETATYTVGGPSPTSDSRPWPR